MTIEAVKFAERVGDFKYLLTPEVVEIPDAQRSSVISCEYVLVVEVGDGGDGGGVSF